MARSDHKTGAAPWRALAACIPCTPLVFHATKMFRETSLGKIKQSRIFSTSPPRGMIRGVNLASQRCRFSSQQCSHALLAPSSPLLNRQRLHYSFEAPPLWRPPSRRIGAASGSPHPHSHLPDKSPRTEQNGPPAFARPPAPRTRPCRRRGPLPAGAMKAKGYQTSGTRFDWTKHGTPPRNPLFKNVPG